MKNNFFLLLVFIIIVPFSCKKLPFFAIEGDSLIISSNKSILKTGGERAKITIIGYRANGEIIHDHTAVIITSSLGSIEPTEVEMINGRAEVEFISEDTVGEAEIKAISGSISSNAIVISITTETLSKINISASPSNFDYGGGRSKIKAIAVDESGNSMENIPIILTATNGSFESNKSIYKTNSEGIVFDYLNITETSTVKAESGKIKSDELELKVEDKILNIVPVSQFTISPSSPKRGETIYFNGSLSSDSDGYIVSWQWDFGDGRTAGGEKTSHIYNWTGTESKTYVVVLKVKDNYGDTHSSTQSINVSVSET
jgi:hypothetical protein